jgi:hypothetical protein
VTDYSRSFEHGKGVPGIFFKYDLEGMILTIHERTTTLYQFLIRLVGVVGKSSTPSTSCLYDPFADQAQVGFGRSHLLHFAYLIELIAR